MHIIHKRKIIQLFITVLMVSCALLSVFQPDFIEGTPLEAIADNDNTTLIITILAFISPLYTLFSQSKDENNKRTLHYELSAFEFRPEHYDLFMHSKGAAQAIPNELHPGGEVYHILQFGEFLGRDSLWIPLEASFSTEDVCESILLRKLKLKYYDGSSIIKWKNLRLSTLSRVTRKISGNYRKDERIPVYCLLGLTQSQRSLLEKNQFKLVFHQELCFAGGIRSVKKITLQFYLSDSVLRLFK